MSAVKQEVCHATPGTWLRVTGELSSGPVSVDAGSRPSRTWSAAIASCTATRSCFHREARSEGSVPVRIGPSVRGLLPKLGSVLTAISTTTAD